MKVMATWSLTSGGLREAAGRFLAGEAEPQPGVKLLGRWHSVDLSCGFSLYETDSPAALYEGAAKWRDLLDLENYIVIEDAEAGPILQKTFGG
jgi:hypothetical protein